MADTREELRRLAKELGTAEAEIRVPKDWRARGEAEVTITLQRASPPMLCGKEGWRWYKCETCTRFYNAAARMGRCVLCQFKALK